MEIFVLSFIVFSLAAMGMAVGILSGRPPLIGGGCRANCAGGMGESCGACKFDDREGGA